MMLLRAIEAIAINTFRETVRDRVLYAFFVFACLITVMGIVLGSLSVGQDIRIIADLGMAVISIIGGIIAVFAGTNLVYKELERRTIYVIFTKPVTSWQFILGKYMGLAMGILVVLACMGAFLILLLLLVQPGHHIQSQLPWIFVSLTMVLLELLFVLALATFFSTFANPMMSVVFTISLWFIGHLGSSLLDLSTMSGSPLISTILTGIYWCLPDLAGLTRVRTELMYGQAPGEEIIAYLVCYVVAYILLLLVFASLVNERREFP